MLPKSGEWSKENHSLFARALWGESLPDVYSQDLDLVFWEQHLLFLPPAPLPSSPAKNPSCDIAITTQWLPGKADISNPEISSGQDLV